MSNSNSEFTAKLLPSQRGVFLDCGGYDGCSAIRFILNNPRFDCFSFEPNPALWPYYENVPSTLVRKAVFKHNNGIEFIVDERDADGSSVIPSKVIDPKPGGLSNNECKKIFVDTVDIKDLILEMSLRYSRIVLKLDIEGAEYDVLERLIAFNLTSHISLLCIEFHWEKCGFPKERHDKVLSHLIGKVPIFEWDALRLSVHSRKDRNILLHNREQMVARALGEIGHYQKLPLGFFDRLLS